MKNWYRPEQKNRYETIYDVNKRAENTTGADLPPMPVYGAQSGGAQNVTKVASGTVASGTATAKGNTKKNSTSAKTVYSAQPSADDMAKLLLAQEKANLLAQQKAAIEGNRQQAMKLLGENLTASQNAAKAANDDAMRQLYIAYMQGIRNIPQQSALWGAGGEIESLKTQHRLNYEDNRAKQAGSYASVLDEIQSRYNSDLLELENKYLSQLMGLDI